MIDDWHTLREEPLSTLMRAALALPLAFLVAILAALAVTLVSTPYDVRYLALALVTPIVVLTLLCISLSWRRIVWDSPERGHSGRREQRSG